MYVQMTASYLEVAMLIFSTVHSATVQDIYQALQFQHVRFPTFHYDLDLQGCLEHLI